MYDQSLMRLRADERARFWESSAKRWCAAFDHVVSCLDPDDPETAAVIEEAERIRQSIPLEYVKEPVDA